MSTTAINGVEYRVVDQDVCDWMLKRVKHTLKESPWYRVSLKAVKHMREHPICHEVNHDGTYTVMIASSSDPGREYRATADVCECQGHHTVGHCYHRMVAKLLEAADRYELRRAAYQAEQARRMVRQVVGLDGSSRWAASYDGTFVGLADGQDEARELIEGWLTQRKWLEQALPSAA